MTVCIFLFAFSSQLGNYYYTESNFRFIRDSSLGLFLFRCTCVAAVFAGCLLDFTTVWSLADILMGMMAIVNLAAIFLLGKKVLIALRDYIRQRKQGKEPVFRIVKPGWGIRKPGMKHLREAGRSRAPKLGLYSTFFAPGCLNQTHPA